MAVWIGIASIGAAGAVGGLLNTLLTSEGLVLWRMERLSDGGRIWRPGFIGNVAIGVVTAVVLAGLYSPLGSVALGGAPSPANVTLTIGALAGALLSGVGGARLLTSEVQKRYGEVTRQNLTATVQTLSQVASLSQPGPPGAPQAGAPQPGRVGNETP
jgi:hypothetical protein